MLSKAQIKQIVEFDKEHREVASSGRPTTRTRTYNLIVPHTKVRNPIKRDATVVRVAVKLAKDGKPLVKVIEFTDLSTATADGKVTINYRDMGYHMLAGWTVYWDEDEYERKNTTAWYYSGNFGEWSDAPYKFRCGLSAPWDPTVNPDALADTRYRYCSFPADDGPRRIGLLDWLMLYRQDSRVELLAKAGLHALINPAGLNALGNKRFLEYIKSHLSEMQTASRKCRSKEMLYCVKHGVSPEEAVDHFAFVTDMRRFLPHFNRFNDPDGKLRKGFRLDYERLKTMIFKWGVSPQEYARYLHEVFDAGLDAKCDGVLYPPVRDGRSSFMERLERLEAENAKRHRKEEREARKAQRERMKLAKAEEAKRIAAEREAAKKILSSRLKEIASFQQSVDKVMKLNINGTTCVIAKSQEELRREGKRMGNCVGCGTYGKGTVFGNTLILQFKDKNGHSWCDAEINRKNWTIRQCYSRGNNIAPNEIKCLATTIAKALKAQHIAHRKSHAFPLLEKKVA